MIKDNGNGWSEYKRVVLNEIEDLKKCYDKIDSKFINLEKKLDLKFAEIVQLNIENAKLKTELRLKSGIWGAIAGGIPTLVGIILYLVFKWNYHYWYFYLAYYRRYAIVLLML